MGHSKVKKHKFKSVALKELWTLQLLAELKDFYMCRSRRPTSDKIGKL